MSSTATPAAAAFARLGNELTQAAGPAAAVTAADMEAVSTMGTSNGAQTTTAFTRPTVN